MGQAGGAHICRLRSNPTPTRPASICGILLSGKIPASFAVEEIAAALKLQDGRVKLL
jgi:hypothetical protein